MAGFFSKLHTIYWLAYSRAFPCYIIALLGNLHGTAAVGCEEEGRKEESQLLC
jgi:hypothetical protein